MARGITRTTPPVLPADNFFGALAQAIQRWDAELAGTDPDTAAQRTREVLQEMKDFADQQRKNFMFLLLMIFVFINLYLGVQIAIAHWGQTMFNIWNGIVAWAFGTFMDYMILKFGGWPLFATILGTIFPSTRKEASFILKILVGITSVIEMAGLVFGYIPFWMSLSLTIAAIVTLRLRIKAGFIAGRPLKIFDYITDWTTQALIVYVVLALWLRYASTLDPNSWGRNPVMFVLIMIALVIGYKLIFGKGHHHEGDGAKSGGGKAPHFHFPWGLVTVSALLFFGCIYPNYKRHTLYLDGPLTLWEQTVGQQTGIHLLKQEYRSPQHPVATTPDTVPWGNGQGNHKPNPGQSQQAAASGCANLHLPWTRIETIALDDQGLNFPETIEPGKPFRFCFESADPNAFHIAVHFPQPTDDITWNPAKPQGSGILTFDPGPQQLANGKQGGKFMVEILNQQSQPVTVYYWKG